MSISFLQLVAIEQNPKSRDITRRSETRSGGDVEAGLAISEMIRHCQKPSASFVSGGRSFNWRANRRILLLFLHR